MVQLKVLLCVDQLRFPNLQIAIVSLSLSSLMATLSSTSVPNLYSQSQAVQHECWKKAMQDELNALTQNHAWDIVKYLDSIKHMDASWFML